MSDLSLKQASNILLSSVLLFVHPSSHLLCNSLEMQISCCSDHCVHSSENSWEAHASPCGPENKAKSPLTVVDFDLLPELHHWLSCLFQFPFGMEKGMLQGLKGKVKNPG